MIEVHTKVDAIRRSKIAFWSVGSTVGLSVGVIASAITSWPRAVLIGLVTGAVVGFVVAFGLFCWPAIRVAWHWAFELSVLSGVLAGYLALTHALPWWAALTLLGLALFGPFTVGRVRRRVWPWVMCAVSRHRLRLCFATFIAAKRSGMTPLILTARPIPAGERVWVWLRPGLAVADLESRLDRLATGCWAAECRIAPASRRFAALIRIDIARRNPLIGLVGSPLVGLVPNHVDVDEEPDGLDETGVGLDLPDTPQPANTPVIERKRPARSTSDRPAGPELVLDGVSPRRGAEDDDLSDWI